MKFEQIDKINEKEYWQKIDKEFSLAAELFSDYLKKIGQEKKAEKIIHDWIQELMDRRSDYGISPIQDVKKDISDLKDLLTIKAENDLLSEEASVDSCYYNHLLLLSLKTSELHNDPNLQYKEDEEIDQADILEVEVNKTQKKAFYEAAKNYLKNKWKYNKNKGINKYQLEKHSLDAKALIVLNELQVLDSFYQNREYYNFETLPAFVADQMIENKQESDLYYSSNFPKFESFSQLVAKDIFNQGASMVASTFLEDFDRFPDLYPVWALDKILKCIDWIRGKENSILSFIDKYIKNKEDIKQAYQLILQRGIKVEDEKISKILSEEDKQSYKETRDKFTTDMISVFGDDENHPNHNHIKDLDKFYQMAEAGYGPVVLYRVVNYDVNFDNKLIIEKLEKNKQSSHILHLYRLLNEAPNELVDNIIAEGDLDILAANLNRVHENEDILIKLWENGYNQAVKKNIKKFRNLTEKFLELLINSGEGHLAVYNIHNFNLNSKTLKNLMDRQLDYFVTSSSVELKYLEEKGLFDYFLEKIKDNPKFLDIAKNKGFTELKTDNKNKFAQIIIKTEAAKNFIFYISDSDFFSELDFQISAKDLDEAIEKKGESQWISLVLRNLKNKPSDSFYVQNIDIFTDNSKAEFVSCFIRLLNKKVLARKKEDLNLLSIAKNDLLKLSGDDEALAIYIKNIRRKNKEEREKYLLEINKQAKGMARNNSNIDDNNPSYELSLRLVYPKRNYDTYSKLKAYKDRNSDLDKLKFNREGYSFNLDGISGYKIKVGEKINLDLINYYKKRIDDIKEIDKHDALLNFLNKNNPDSKAKTLEAKILEYLNINGYNRDSINVLLAYQLMGEYDQFVANSRDRLSEAEDEATKNYILLDELIERYGDQLKETIKVLKDKIENSDDKELFISEDDSELNNKLMNIGDKIISDLSKLPNDKLSDLVIRKKIEKTLLNILQKNEFIKNNAQEITKDFSASNFKDFAFVWKEKMKIIKDGIKSQELFNDLEKIQSKIYQELQKEVTKYEEIFEVDEERRNKKMRKSREIRAYFSKNKENAHARMVADICLASDETMLEDKEYFELVLFDEERVKCVGTTMLKSLVDTNKKFLLYCPNPSVALVSEVSAKKLYNKITNIVKKFAQENNYDAIILDKKHGMSTNRGGLFQKALENSVLRQNNQEIIINLKKEHYLSKYAYKNDLRAIYLKD